MYSSAYTIYAFAHGARLGVFRGVGVWRDDSDLHIANMSNFFLADLKLSARSYSDSIR